MYWFLDQGHWQYWTYFHGGRSILKKSPDSLKTVNVMGIDASYDCSNDEVRRESECENASVRQI